MSTREYQDEAESAAHHEWETVTSTAVVMPTGTGKTVLFAKIIKRRLPGRALILAHREELIWQAREKVERFAGVDCGIEMAELHTNATLFGETPVVVSTVQTLNSPWGDRLRMGRFKPTDFDLLVCDECHHATAPSYRRIFDYFKQNPKLKILGVTATPDRADEEALGQVFDSVAYDYEILDAIHDGWLVPISQQFVSVGGLDFSEVRTTAGDLNGADLANIMESEKNMQGVTAASLQIIGNRRAILFTCSVKQAEQASDIFNRHKPGMAAWVCGATNKDDRREMLTRFKNGEIQVMCNCGVLTEGFDDPGVEVIIMGRPTKSRSLYAQMAGRGTRPLDGLVDGQANKEDRKRAILESNKPQCLIVDFVGNSGRHKLMSAADILGGKVSDEAIARAVDRAKKTNSAVRMDTALDEEEQKLRDEIAQRKQAELARKAKLVAKVKYSAKDINPFDVFEIEPVKIRGWDNGRVLSEAQSQMLMRQGINPDKMPYAQARQLITEMFKRMDKKLCTLKQAKLLMRYGYETKGMTFENASKLITELSKNWKGRTPSTPATTSVSFADEGEERSPF